MKTGLNRVRGNSAGTRYYYPSGMETKVSAELQDHTNGITVEKLQLILIEKYAVKDEKRKRFGMCVRSTIIKLVRVGKVTADRPKFSRNRIYKIKN